MTKQRTCRHCGGPLDQQGADRKGTGHFNPFICMGVLRERAEAAEAERDRLLCIALLPPAPPPTEEQPS